jgi:SOS-response transcriptional repressor LexA
MHPAEAASNEAPADCLGPELSDREHQVLQYLIDFTEEHFFQPSVREICVALEISSTKTVADVIQTLAQKGYIVGGAQQRGARSLRLVGLKVSVTRTLLPPSPAPPTARPAARPDSAGA